MDKNYAFKSSLMNYLLKKFDIRIKTVAPYNHHSSQAEHGIKLLCAIVNKYLTGIDQLGLKYLPLTTLAYNTFNRPNLVYYSPNEFLVEKPNYFNTWKQIQVLSCLVHSKTTTFC